MTYVYLTVYLEVCVCTDGPAAILPRGTKTPAIDIRARIETS